MAARQTHTVIAPATAFTYTASFTAAGASCPTGQYFAEYFANRTLAGSPTFTRCEATINNNWGSGGPGNGVGPDNFSVRWTGAFDLPAGTHLFEVRANDGIRLLVDSAILIDQWRDQTAAVRYRGSRNLAAGIHQVRVEFYDNVGAAVAEVTRHNCPAGQFVGQYFNNLTLANAPAFTRCDASIAFSSGTGGPGAGVGVEQLSTRWTARPTFAAGTYRFTAASRRRRPRVDRRRAGHQRLARPGTYHVHGHPNPHSGQSRGSHGVLRKGRRCGRPALLGPRLIEGIWPDRSSGSVIPTFKRGSWEHSLARVQ